MSEEDNVTTLPTKQIIFHGGCHGCTRQETKGVNGCYDCCYFDANWNKPDLNNRPPDEAELIRRRVKKARRSGL